MLWLWARLGGIGAVALGLLALALAVGGTTMQLSARPVYAQEHPDVANPFEGDAAAIEEGRELFSRRCVFCHGTGAKGGKGPNLTSGKWKYGGRNADLFATILA